MAWSLLLLAGLLEIVWAIALKSAEGFSRAWPSIVGLSAATASFGLLALALKSLPVGTAYAIWTGIGVVGVALVGILAQGESASPSRIALLALVVCGIAGLKLVES